MPERVAPASELEGQINGLYAGTLEEFVAARKRLAASLRLSGNRADAKRVTMLAKPTLSAWVTNAAIRQAPDLVEELSAAGVALGAVQRSGRTGNEAGEAGAKAPSSFRTALEAQRSALAGLVRVAQSVIERDAVARGEQPSWRSDVLDRVEKNLRFGPTAPEEAVRVAFQNARLTKDIPAPGFGAVLGAVASLEEASIAAADPGASARAEAPGPSSRSESGSGARRASHESARDQTPLEGSRPDRVQERRALDEAARARQRELGERRQRLRALREEGHRVSVETTRASSTVERAARSQAERRRAVTLAESELERARARLLEAEDAHRQAMSELEAMQAAKAELEGRIASAEVEAPGG